MKRHKFLKAHSGDDLDPLSSLTNLFDVAMVFAVALMVALVEHLQIQDMLLEEDFTIVKNPGEDDMEIITKKGEEITKYKQNDSAVCGQIRKVRQRNG